MKVGPGTLTGLPQVWIYVWGDWGCWVASECHLLCSSKKPSKLVTVCIFVTCGLFPPLPFTWSLILYQQSHLPHQPNPTHLILSHSAFQVCHSHYVNSTHLYTQLFFSAHYLNCFFRLVLIRSLMLDVSSCFLHVFCNIKRRKVFCCFLLLYLILFFVVCCYFSGSLFMLLVSMFKWAMNKAKTDI